MAEVNVGLPDLIEVLQGVTIGDRVAVSAVAAVTVAEGSSAGVSPAVGGALDVKLKDWQLIHLEARAGGGVVVRPRVAAPRASASLSLVRAGVRASTRFGFGIVVDAIGQQPFVMPTVQLGWRFGRADRSVR